MNRPDQQPKEVIETEPRSAPNVDLALPAVALAGADDACLRGWSADVRTAARDLAGKIRSEQERAHSDMAAAVEHALERDVLTSNTGPAREQRRAVAAGGRLGRHFEHEAAENGARDLTGVDLGKANEISGVVSALSWRRSGEQTEDSRGSVLPALTSVRGRGAALASVWTVPRGAILGPDGLRASASGPTVVKVYGVRVVDRAPALLRRRP